MATWATLGVPRGSYISPSFYVSNSLDKYIANISGEFKNTYNQQIRYYFRASYNQVDWYEWKEFGYHSRDLLDEYNLWGLYIQFKIVLISESEAKKQHVKSIKLELKPYSHINNSGDLPIKPKMWIRKKNGKGSIALINHTTGQRVELKNLNNNEEVYIDNENEEIISSNQPYGVYRYDDHNDEYLELAKGDNYLTSDGDFDFDIRYKAMLIQE